MLNGASSPEDSVNLLMDTHFPGSFRHDPRFTARPSVNGPGVRLADAEDVFSTDKVSKAVDSFGLYKAAGPDGFQPVVLRCMGPKALRRLTQIYQASYLLGYVPWNLRKSCVVFIPKQGKDDYSNPRSFHPITLSSFLIKGMERVLMWHLNATTLLEEPFHANQHAFRKGRNCETALSTMVEYIESSFIKNQFTLGVFLDIQGAFDNVRPQSIIAGLRKKGVDDHLIGWYENYLNSRISTASYRGVEVHRWVKRGTPQGGVLSPLMWNLAFDGLLELFDEGPVKACGYADDASLVISGANPHYMVCHMQTAIDKALQWGQAHGLEFSPQKTVAVLFTRKTKYNLPPEIKVSGISVPYSSTVKYLGITLDSKLLWTMHIKLKMRKCKLHLLMLKNAMGKLWGAPPHVTRWAYTGIVRPSLTYGCLVWVKALRGSVVQKELTRLNRLVLLSLGHFRKSTPTAGLEIIAYVRPLDLHIRCEVALAKWRTQGHNPLPEGVMATKSAHLKGHRQISQEFLDSLGVEILASDCIPLEYHWDRKFRIGELNVSLIPDDGDWYIYTDGSRYNDKAGSGVAVYEKDNLRDELSYHLGDHATVFQAEVYAIFKAAEWLLEVGVKYERIYFFVDCQAAIQAINKPFVVSATVRRALLACSEVAKHNTLVFHWIKAHVGIQGNEHADSLAKRGAQDVSLMLADTPFLSVRTARTMLQDKFDEQWTSRWQARTDCRQTKIWFPEVNKPYSQRLMHLDRTTLSIMVQIITGHNFLRRHSSLINPDEESECRLCLEDEESSFHIVAECPALARPRLQVLGSSILAEPLTWSVTQVLSFLQEAHIEHLFDQRGD